MGILSILNAVIACQAATRVSRHLPEVTGHSWLGPENQLISTEPRKSPNVGVSFQGKGALSSLPQPYPED